MIRFEEVDGGNWRTDLNVAPSQKHYVSDRVAMLARAYALREARAQVYFICDGEAYVGMVMYNDCDPLDAFDINQLFIDARYQGRGYGTAATKMVLDRMRQDGKYKKAVLCYIEGNESAKKLYEKFGFRETDRDGDEIVMEMEL